MTLSKKCKNIQYTKWREIRIPTVFCSYSCIYIYIYVEKRKISYFGLARNLIQHWISPNQDDLSYSARTFISG